MSNTSPWALPLQPTTILELSPDVLAPGVWSFPCPFDELPVFQILRSGRQFLFTVLRKGHIDIQTTHATLADCLRQIAHSLDVYRLQTVNYTVTDCEDGVCNDDSIF